MVLFLLRQVFLSFRSIYGCLESVELARSCPSYEDVDHDGMWPRVERSVGTSARADSLRHGFCCSAEAMDRPGQLHLSTLSYPLKTNDGSKLVRAETAPWTSRLPCRYTVEA